MPLNDEIPTISEDDNEPDVNLVPDEITNSPTTPIAGEYSEIPSNPEPANVPVSTDYSEVTVEDNSVRDVPSANVTTHNGDETIVPIDDYNNPLLLEATAEPDPKQSSKLGAQQFRRIGLILIIAILIIVGLVALS